MNMEHSEDHAFLYELYTRTNGDPEQQVSMYDIGETIGIDKDTAGVLAQELCIQGLAELKTLSGGVGITVEGLQKLNVALPESAAAKLLTLGSETILTDPAAEVVRQLVEEISQAASAGSSEYETTEELVMDLKTIQVQMLSNSPKTRIIKEVLRSIHANIEKRGQTALSGKLKTVLEN